MEKAQERKKKANLDGCKGNSKTYNPFPISWNPNISALADVTGVRIGNSDKDVSNVLADMQENESMRANNFNASCNICHVEGGESSLTVDSPNDLNERGDVALATPQAHIVVPQMEGSDMMQG
jgi:hypothetical protein